MMDVGWLTEAALRVVGFGKYLASRSSGVPFDANDYSRSGRMYPSSSRRVSIGLGLVAAVVFVPGCTRTESSRSEATESLSPIEEAFGGMDLTFENFTISDQIRTDEAIRDCMALQGFDYKVMTREELEQNSPEFIDLPPHQYAQEYGYGVAASIGADFGGFMNRTTSPLSPSEKERFDYALFGDLVNSDNGGCMLSSVATFGIPPEHLMAIYDGLAEIDHRIASDPDVLEMEEEWSDCMAEQGYAVHSRHQMQPIFAAYAADFGSYVFSDHEIQGNELPAAPTDVESFRQLEIDAALLDLECWGPLQDDWIEIRDSYQRDFLAKHPEYTSMN